MRGNGVDVFGGRMKRQLRAGAAGQFNHALQQFVRALRTVVIEHRFERFHPFTGFVRVAVVFQQIT